MQRIEADAVGAETGGEFDQPFEIGEIADSPVARRADAVELDRQQPAAVEIAAEGLGRRDDQRHVFGERGGIGQLQPVDAFRQIRRPDDDAIVRSSPSRDNLKIRQRFSSAAGTWQPA